MTLFASRTPTDGAANGRRRLVSLLDADPELFAGLDADELAAARPHAVAEVVTLESGTWSSAERLLSRAPFGALVLRGLLARRVSVGGRAGTELLAAGDLLRPWIKLGGSLLDPEIGWEVIEPVELALLDGRFGRVAGHWPAINSALLDRMMLRTGWLTFQLAICQRVSVKPRLRATFWSLADRWGRMTSSGILIPVRLTHAVLAEVVGARRPSVTTALGELRREGTLLRRPDGHWVLTGEPPAALGAELFEADDLDAAALDPA